MCPFSKRTGESFAMPCLVDLQFPVCHAYESLEEIGVWHAGEQRWVAGVSQFLLLNITPIPILMVEMGSKQGRGVHLPKQQGVFIASCCSDLLNQWDLTTESVLLEPCQHPYQIFSSCSEHWDISQIFDVCIWHVVILNFSIYYLSVDIWLY